MCFRARRVTRVISRRQPQGRPPWSQCWKVWESCGTSSSTTRSTTWTTSWALWSSTVELPAPKTSLPLVLHLLAKQDLVRAWGEPYCCSFVPPHPTQNHNKVPEGLLFQIISQSNNRNTANIVMDLFLVISNRCVCCSHAKAFVFSIVRDLLSISRWNPSKRLNITKWQCSSSLSVTLAPPLCKVIHLKW